MQRLARQAGSFFEIGQWTYAAMEVWLGGWMRPPTLKQRAAERLQALLNIARKGTPFYGALYRDLPAEGVPLSALPIVTKKMLMADLPATLTDRTISRGELDDFVADANRVGQAFRGRYAVWASSGTSGEPGIFLHDATAVAIYEALETLRFRGVTSLADYAVRVFAGERFAMVAATGGHFAGVASIEHLRRSYPWLASCMRTFSLLTPVKELVARLNSYRPTLLATYPTAAELLADEQEAGRLHLQLAELWTGGECLAPCVQARLQSVFGCRVRNSYGASEFLSIAYACAHGAMHVNADWVTLEPVDAQYRPVSPGTPSHTTLLTNLANRAQPLIRYDLGDSITVLPAPCACGSLLPAIRVEGRHDDVLRLSDRRGVMVKLLPLVLTTVLEDDAHVHDFQLVQTGPRTLRVALGAEPPEAGERVRMALAAYLAQQDISGVVIETDRLAPQRSFTSGKLRRVVYSVCSEAPVPEPVHS